MSSKSSVLERIHIALESQNIPKRGRNKIVAKKTGYSPSMVAKLMSGNAAINERFISALCSAFGFRHQFIQDGDGLIRSDGYRMEEGQIFRDIDLSSVEPVIDVENEFDHFFDSVNEARALNISYMKRLIERLHNEEFKLVEEFIFSLMKQRR